MQFPPYLFSFTPEATVSPEAAKQDKIEIEIGTWRITVPPSSHINFLRELSPPMRLGFLDDESGVMEFARYRPEGDENRLWLFRAFTETRFDRTGWAKVKFRKRALNLENESEAIPRSLISGSCTWQRTSSRSLIATLSLSINPTRFVRNCTAHNPEPNHLMSLSRLRPAPYGEISQDGRDNWLPLDRRTQGRIRLYGWRSTLIRYLQTIETGFEQELDAACANVGCSGSWTRDVVDYNLKSLETYWEWGAENPLALVESLGAALREISHREFRINRYTRDGWDGLKSSHKSEWSPHEFLCIYNKTNRRIRMEVTHNLNASSRFQFPSEGPGNPRPSSAHTADSLNGILQLVERLNERAASVANEFLEYVRRTAGENIVSAPVYQALFRIAQTLGDEGLGLEIIAQLVHAQSVRLPRGDAPERRHAVQLLVDRGILVPAGQRHPLLYHPAPYYRNAFRALASNGNFPALFTTAGR